MQELKQRLRQVSKLAWVGVAIWVIGVLITLLVVDDWWERIGIALILTAFVRSHFSDAIPSEEEIDLARDMRG